MYENEAAVYDSLATCTSRPPPNSDPLELFAGCDKPTTFASWLGLRALQPDPEDQARVRKAVCTFKPWLLVIGFPCARYNIFNENMNYPELYAMREEDAPMRKFISDLLLEQNRDGRMFLLESPVNSRLWLQEEFVQVYQTLALKAPRVTVAHTAPNHWMPNPSASPCALSAMSPACFQV